MDGSLHRGGNFLLIARFNVGAIRNTDSHLSRGARCTQRFLHQGEKRL
jgi:hypothetical protein